MSKKSIIRKTKINNAITALLFLGAFIGVEIVLINFFLSSSGKLKMGLIANLIGINPVWEIVAVVVPMVLAGLLALAFWLVNRKKFSAKQLFS